MIHGLDTGFLVVRLDETVFAGPKALAGHDVGGHVQPTGDQFDSDDKSGGFWGVWHVPVHHAIVKSCDTLSGTRPMREEWVRNLRDQCEAAGVAFFFKQWGGVRKNVTGRLLDGRTHDDRPLASPHRIAEKTMRVRQLRRFELQVV